MKIQFDDKSYVYFYMSDDNSKIILTISAKDYDNPLKKIVNTCEVSILEFKDLISDLKYKE
jgi:hypothetical protein